MVYERQKKENYSSWDASIGEFAFLTGESGILKWSQRVKSSWEKKKKKKNKPYSRLACLALAPSEAQLGFKLSVAAGQ